MPSTGPHFRMRKTERRSAHKQRLQVSWLTLSQVWLVHLDAAIAARWACLFHLLDVHL